MLGKKDIIWFLVQYEVGEWYIHRWKITRIEEREYATVDIYLKYAPLPRFSDTVCSQYDQRLNPAFFCSCGIFFRKFYLPWLDQLGKSRGEQRKGEMKKSRDKGKNTSTLILWLSPLQDMVGPALKGPQIGIWNRTTLYSLWKIPAKQQASCIL